MALIACLECQKQISNKAESCPHCGVKPKRGGSGAMLLKLTIIMLILGAVVSVVLNTNRKAEEAATVAAMTPEKQTIEANKNAEQQKGRDSYDRAMVGIEKLKAYTRNPDSLTVSYVGYSDIGGVCMEYRAQNGFGGMNVGQAVIEHAGTRMRSNNSPGFAKSWKTECTNKSLNDITGLIKTGLKYSS